MAKTQTNTELLGAIFEQVTEQGQHIVALTSSVKQVKQQVEYTNGKVAGLMEDKIRREEREKMALEIKVQGGAPSIQAETVVMQQKWFQNEKLVSGVVAVLLAIAAGIGFYAGGTQ